ncbi:hypothetical protein SDC9_172881 [bioreactor metagenome]|uniref:DUF2975 domain-containing protein n=1 Tax=bioreactor metagenome TaxID=1076179 RepID=A0A645GHJ2_9ZZZZ
MLKNTTKIKSALSNFLIVLFFIIGLILIMGVFIGIPYIFNNIKDINNIISAICGFVIGIIYLIIIVSLIDIVISSKINIFIRVNVNRFKRIGYLLLINLGIDYIFSIIYGVSGMRFVDLAPGVFLTPSMCVYFIAGLLCFVIADAFDQAITIKEENEFTV